MLKKILIAWVLSGLLFCGKEQDGVNPSPTQGNVVKSVGSTNNQIVDKRFTCALHRSQAGESVPYTLLFQTGGKVSKTQREDVQGELRNITRELGYQEQADKLLIAGVEYYLRDGMLFVGEENLEKYKKDKEIIQRIGAALQENKPLPEGDAIQFCQVVVE
ncbi:MAG: hypothetical protein AAF518_04415 [Spirochaetota bacterium]